MAEPTNGKTEGVQKLDAAENTAESVENTVSDKVDTNGQSDTVEDAQVVEPKPTEPVDTSSGKNAPDKTEVPAADPVEASPEPVIIRETVVKRKGGFFPMVIGGIIAAGIGFAVSEYIFVDGLPFGAAVTQDIDLSSELRLQSSRIDELTQMLANQPSVSIDTETFEAAAIDAAVALTAVGDLQSRIGTISDSLGAFEARIVDLETRPSTDGGGVSVAMESELKALRAAVDIKRSELDAQKAEIGQMIADAQDFRQSSEGTARQTMARAAVTRILVALDSGATFEDALADVQANSDIALPEALTQSAASGVSTLFELTESYPSAARAALAAVRSEDTGGSVASFFAKKLEVRSLEPREGDDPDAVLSRIEAAVNEGRIADALALTDLLPDVAKAPLADWMAQANLRLSAAREAQALDDSLNSQ